MSRRALALTVRRYNSFSNWLYKFGGTMPALVRSPLCVPLQVRVRWPAQLAPNLHVRREVQGYMDAHPDIIPSGWDDRHGKRVVGTVWIDSAGHSHLRRS